MRAPVSNLGLKAVSLVLAVLIWFVIAGEKTAEMGLRVRVELKNMPKDLELAGELTETVEVRLRATPNVIERLTPGDVAVTLNLAGIHEGERMAHLTEENVRIPFGVKVVKIQPSILRLRLEQVRARMVPVRPRLVGRPAADYEVEEVKADPPEVQIVGPRSRADAVESVFTEPVSVEAVRDTVVETVNVGLDEPMVHLQGSPLVKVTVRLRERQEENRTFEDLVVTVRGGAAVLAPARVRVALAGPSGALRRVTSSQVRPYVDVGQLRGAGHSLPVSVDLSAGPAGITISRVEPPKVTVRAVKRGG